MEKQKSSEPEMMAAGYAAGCGLAYEETKLQVKIQDKFSYKGTPSVDQDTTWVM